MGAVYTMIMYESYRVITIVILLLGIHSGDVIIEST